MEKSKTDGGGKESTRLERHEQLKRHEQTHNLVHISNVVLSDHLKGGQTEGGKYREELSQPIGSSLAIPLLEKIDIRDFDEYIRYITKINTLSDVNIRNVEEISLHHFERILRTTSSTEGGEQHKELLSQGRGTQLGIWGHSGDSSSFAHSNGRCASPQAQPLCEPNHDALLAGDAWCDLSILSRQQEKLSAALDDIDRDINALIRREFQNYLLIIAILNKLKGEIESVHDEIKTLREHVDDVKDMLLKIIHLKKYNDLKGKCKQVNRLLKKFLLFRRLIIRVKKFLQKRQFYHCLVVVNKIFKIYFFFKKKTKLLYFHKYFCNFNISYLQSFLSQNFLFLFFFHSLLFLFRPQGVRKAPLGCAHLVKKWARPRVGGSHAKRDTCTTLGDTPPDHLNRNYHFFTAPPKAKIDSFVKTHKRVNEQFMRDFHRKREKFFKCRKREEARVYVKRWRRGAYSHVHKTIRTRATFDRHLAHLNDLFTPALFFNNFFESLRNFCKRENYLKHFVDDLFYGVLLETVSSLQRDQLCNFGERSLFGSEEVAAQSAKSEEEESLPPEEAAKSAEGERLPPEEATIQLDPHLKPPKGGKPGKTNQPLTGESTNHVEGYPSGRITLTCEHLVMDKCRKKKILTFDEDTWNELHRQVGLLPVPNLVHLLETFFWKIKLVRRRINKWASFLMGKIVCLLWDGTFAESFARHTPHLTQERSTGRPMQTPMHTLPFCRSDKPSHMLKCAFAKLWKSYRDVHHALFKLLLERISDVLNVRRKCKMHLGINQVISLYWAISPMLSFVRRKGRRLRQEYSLFFVRSVHRVVRSVKVSRTMLLWGNPHEGRQPRRVKITLKRNQLTIAKKVKALNCNVGTSLGGRIKLGEVPLVCLLPREEAKHCEEQAHVRSDVVYKSKGGITQPGGQFDAHRGEAYTLDPTGECHLRCPLPRCFSPGSANLRVGSQKLHVPRRVCGAILRRGEREKAKLGRFLQRVSKKTPHGKEAKWRPTHEERKFCRQIKRSIRNESLVAINHFYEFKKIQMEKSLEIEKWNVLEDIPHEINAQTEKYFKIKNEHTNKICFNDEPFYLTNSGVSFLCILFQYIHCFLSLPDVSFEIVSKILTFYEKQLLKTVSHFIMEGHAVTNCTLKSITIKTLALVIHTLDFADSTLRRVYAIWRHLLRARQGKTPAGISGQMSCQVSGVISVQVNGEMLPNSPASRREDPRNGQTNGTPFADHRRDTQLVNATTNLWGNPQRRYPPGDTNEAQNGSSPHPDDKCTKGERTPNGKRTNCGDTTKKSPLEKNAKHTHDEILQGMDTDWVASVLADFAKCLKHPTPRNRNGILRGIRLSKRDEEKVKANFKHVLDKSSLLKKKLAEKIIDILSSRFDYYTNIWLLSDSLLENHLVNSLSYECDILPYGMQLRSTFKLLTTYLREEDTRNIYRELFQDIANRFSLRINVLKGNDKYKKIISRLMDESTPERSPAGKSSAGKSAAGKSQIDQLIMHYHNSELKEKTAHNIRKNVGDKILIDMTNVLIILYKAPLLTDIIETFLSDFLKICKSHWYVTVDPFVILSKYKKYTHLGESPLHF
ncbi:Vps54-like protein, putative [Plasmodium vivax]|uniref:Vps54-like protein, putative n=1 Tax=Plasmodium vivax TaxID=5855 RepID=A0A1G4HLC8_PLAVI|nr:Vps54-like protein, putative [Plasmodium vivax]